MHFRLPRLHLDQPDDRMTNVMRSRPEAFVPDGYGVVQHVERLIPESLADLLDKALCLSSRIRLAVYPDVSCQHRVQSAAASPFARRLHCAQGFAADGRQPGQGGSGRGLAVALSLDRHAAGLQPAQAACAAG